MPLRSLNIRSKLYKCPVHDVWLELVEHELSPVAKVLSRVDRVSFYRCPMTYQNGQPCGYCKPNKWERKDYGRTPQPVRDE